MKYLISGLLLLALLPTCTKDKKDPCTYNPCEISAPASEITVVQSHLSANSISATKHCSGMFYVIDAAGTGTLPTICSTVVVKYKGQLSNGTVFDQATTEKNFNLKLLIESWRKGMMLLRPGGKIRMWVPPSLAYGSQDIKDGTGTIIIPANSMLIFEIELVKVL